ncbi:MAG: restriction endonuclease subunit S, partial [Saprospiraceae bacterium]
METKKQDWEIVKLKKVLKQYRITVWLDDTKQYNQLTNSKHTGIKARGYKIGSEIGRKRQFVVDLDKHPNTILFTRQTIQQDEAIGLCPYEVNGCIVTENMPLFAVENADPNFIAHYFKTETFLKQLHLTAAIGTSQQSILEETFLNFEIPLPPLSEQQRIAERLAALKGKIDAVRALRDEQDKEMKGLLLMQYQKVIEGAEWKPLKEVAPLVRRKVDLQPNTVYSEIGVRSFGKGVFEKPSFNSDELSWEKPNWIKEGDLLMSNIKAWEGAVAAVGKEHDGKVG